LWKNCFWLYWTFLNYIPKFQGLRFYTNSKIYFLNIFCGFFKFRIIKKHKLISCELLYFPISHQDNATSEEGPVSWVSHFCQLVDGVHEHVSVRVSVLRVDEAPVVDKGGRFELFVIINLLRFFRLNRLF
jgi:hypothetical protein